MAKIRNLVEIIHSLDQFTPGANDHFITQIENLHGRVDALGDVADGNTPLVSKMVYYFIVSSPYVQPVAIAPVICQSAGTFTNQLNSVSSRVDNLMNEAFDDEVGWDFILDGANKMRITRSIAPENGAINPPAWRTTEVYFKLEVPQKFLSLLNKEAQTERLQTLYLAVFGTCRQTGSNINVTCIREIHYRLVPKTIVIR